MIFWKLLRKDRGHLLKTSSRRGMSGLRLTRDENRFEEVGKGRALLHSQRLGTWICSIAMGMEHEHMICTAR